VKKATKQAYFNSFFGRNSLKQPIKSEAFSLSKQREIVLEEFGAGSSSQNIYHD